MSGWDWQAWTEMVMPISSSKISGMSPAYDFNHSSFQNPCFKDYAVQPRNRWISTDFDGQDLNMTLKTFWSNIIFSNGVLDPWSSVLQNVSETIIALVTKLDLLIKFGHACFIDGFNFRWVQCGSILAQTEAWKFRKGERGAERFGL